MGCQRSVPGGAVGALICQPFAAESAFIGQDHGHLHPAVAVTAT